MGDYVEKDLQKVVVVIKEADGSFRMPDPGESASTVSVTSIAAGDNNIGNVDVVTLPALPAGTNNIGDVDVVTLPSLPAGTNNIGDVDVLTLPALPSGTNVIGYTGDEWYFWLANGRNHQGAVRVDSGLNSTCAAHLLVAAAGGVDNPNGRSAVVTRIDISCTQAGRIRMAVGSGSWGNSVTGAKANKRTDTAASSVVTVAGHTASPTGSPVFSGEYQVEASRLFTIDLADSPILLVPGSGLLGVTTSGMSAGVILSVTFHWTEITA